MRWRPIWLCCLAGLLGCQSASQPLSVYAPFGPAVVPAPNLARENAAPYYTAVGDPKAIGQPSSADKSPPGNATNSMDNKLSHYDPYRGILLPGNYSPTSVGLKSSTLAASDPSSETSATRTGPSNEEPIRIVEAGPKGLGSAIDSTIAKATAGQRSSNAVRFQASLPSGAVRSVEAVPAVNKSTPVSEVARVPKSSISLPSGSDGSTSSPTDLLTPLRLGTPPASPAAPTTPGVIPAKPAEPRRLSLWSSPRDGSRVEPASYSGSVLTMPQSTSIGSWRQRTP